MPEVGQVSSSNGAGARALVVVDEALAGEELRETLVAHLGSGVAEAFVVAPALAGSALEHTMGDVDAAIGPARERLDRTLQELRAGRLDADAAAGGAAPP